MKKKIQLTESQLHRVIKEAIKEEYNGALDWKTLYNAADKARQRGDRDRMYKFGTAARDAFAKKHDMRKIEGGWLSKGGTIDDSEPLRREVDMSYQWDDDGYAPWVDARIDKYDQDEWDRWKDKARQEVKKYGFVVSSPKPSSQRVTSSSGVSYGGKSLDTPEFNDVDNFVNGRSKYIKGKGWNESIVRRVTENVIRRLTEGMEEDGEQENISPILEKIVVVLGEQANNFWNELIEKYGEDVSQWPLDYKDGYWQQTKDVDVNIAEDRKYGTWNGSVKFQLWIEPYFGYAPEDCSTYADYIDSNIYLEKDGQKIPYNGDGKLTPEDLSVVEDILEEKEEYFYRCWLSIGHKPLWHPEINEPF